MKILILGGDGMLGHQLLASLADHHDVRVTLRQPVSAYADYGRFTSANSIGGVDALDIASVRRVVHGWTPDAVINCIGIVKQRSESHIAIPAIEVNALLPHRLLEVCRDAGARFVHISTDCVFSGRRGNYAESDIPDPVDLYGRSKLLGEVTESPGITLRSSIIGLELKGFTGLIEWFLAQRGIIRGFRRAIYTGFTTAEFARIIDHVLVRCPALTGVWQVASAPISKYALLTMLNEQLGPRDVTVEPDDDFQCDRSLSGEAFTEVSGYAPPPWDMMLTELSRQIVARGERGTRSAEEYR